MRPTGSGALRNHTPGAGQLLLSYEGLSFFRNGTPNPQPAWSLVVPFSATAGIGNLTISVTGSRFVPGAVWLWNGAERTTTLVDSAHLKVAVPAFDVAKSGMPGLVVKNPGSSNSAAPTFTIN
jgi:hypothetical protein